MKVAIFHHEIGQGSAIGRILARLAEGLVNSGYKVTIFTGEVTGSLERPKAHIVRIPIIKRPLVLRFLSYHLVASTVYFARRLFLRESFNFKVGIESNWLFVDICYPHSCHRAYLKREWKEVKANMIWWLRLLRWLNHWTRSILEPVVFREARIVVVPSHGLAREIEEEYPFTREKIIVVPNFIDHQRWERPKFFDRADFRIKMGLAPTDIVAAFTALGAFEHKGLHLVIDALERLPTNVKLLVIGGKEHELKAWKNKARTRGLNTRVLFVGMQSDIRPFLWASDVFVFPSAKEIFPLAVLEAAAAGLPLVVTRVYGVEEFMRNEEMGYIVERSVTSISEALLRFANLSPEMRLVMGKRARSAVEDYSFASFINKWIGVLESMRE